MSRWLPPAGYGYRAHAVRPPILDTDVAREAQHHLATALDEMAQASYLEAHLDPSVARAIRAAHRAVAKATNRAARKNRE